MPGWPCKPRASFGKKVLIPKIIATTIIKTKIGTKDMFILNYFMVYSTKIDQNQLKFLIKYTKINQNQLKSSKIN